jgi:hypothetical protein
MVALHAYHDQHSHFPPAVVYNKEGKPLYSWRVMILPFLDREQLYKEFKLDEPWDSPHNKKLLEEMPSPYAPIGRTTPQPYSTYYQAFVGKGTVFENKDGGRLMEIKDGFGETLMIAEANTAVPWTKPEDVLCDSNKALLPRVVDPSLEGFYAACADGSAHFIRQKRIDEKTLRALITPNGGEKIKLPW